MAELAGQIVSAEDRRGAERHEVNEEALTLTRGSDQPVSCVVRDISETGARLRVDLGTFLPRRFKLCIAEQHILADCEIVWRKRNEVGVKFSSLVSIK